MSNTQHADELRRRAEEQLAARHGEIETLERADLVSLAHELAVHQTELEIQNEELRRAQLEAQEARDRYLDLYDFAPVGYFTLDEHGRIVEANLTGCRLLRAERRDLLNTRFTRFLAQEETDKFHFHRQKALASAVQQACELKMQKADGAGFDARLESIRATEGRLRVAVIDITERKRAEQALQESEARLAKAQATVHLANWEVDVRTNGVRGSQELYRLFNLEPDLALDAYIEKFQPEDKRRVVESIQAAIHEGKPYSIDYRIVPRPGEVRYIHAEGEVTRDNNGLPITFFGTVQDITERKVIENTQSFLAQSGWPAFGEDFFDSLARYLGESLGMDYVCIDRLEGAGLSARTVAVYFDGKFEDNVTYALKDTPCGEVVRSDLCCFPKDVRHLFPQDLVLQEMKAEGYVGTILRDSKGQPIGLIAVIGRRPIANPHLAEFTLQLVGVRAAGELERRRAEEALRDLNATLEGTVAERTAELWHRARQLQKMTLEVSLAEDRERKRMADILHDDLQQQLVAAKFHLSLLNSRAKDDPRQRAIIAQVDQMLKEAVEKSRSLAHDLSPVVLHQGDLRRTFEWLAQQMQMRHGLTVRVNSTGEVNLQSEALRVFLYKAGQELLFNVVKHARVEEAAVRLRRLGRYVGLSVSDRGRGFDPQGLKQATGFGLFGIRERIELLGGRMKIRSAPGKGSTFFIIVPDGESISPNSVHDAIRGDEWSP